MELLGVLFPLTTSGSGIILRRLPHSNHQYYIRYQELITQVPLKEVVIEITPDPILRTERKGMLTCFFRRYMTKPYFTLQDEKLEEQAPPPLEPHTHYERLDFVRNVLG